MPVCCPTVGKGGGIQEAGENPARSRHCDRRASPSVEPLPQPELVGAVGRLGESEDPGVRRLIFCPETRTGRGPQRRFVMEGNSLERRISLGEVPLWSWVATALLLAMLFVLLSASGELLVPLLGQAADVANYLHEFAHDGRHLLAVPCH